VLQKFVTYQLRIAIVGDITSLSAASKALHDFVVECNRGSTVWFVRNMDELNDRLRQVP
jgi:FPC/CPF motif-containing protein YcgG